MHGLRGLRRPGSDADVRRVWDLCAVHGRGCRELQGGRLRRRHVDVPRLPQGLGLPRLRAAMRRGHRYLRRLHQRRRLRRPSRSLGVRHRERRLCGVHARRRRRVSRLEPAVRCAELDLCRLHRGRGLPGLEPGMRPGDRSLSDLHERRGLRGTTGVGGLQPDDGELCGVHAFERPGLWRPGLRCGDLHVRRLPSRQRVSGRAPSLRPVEPPVLAMPERSGLRGAADHAGLRCGHRRLCHVHRLELGRLRQPLVRSGIVAVLGLCERCGLPGPAPGLRRGDGALRTLWRERRLLGASRCFGV